ncbi:uncharacterized protein LOC141651228 [Silene latifolia]|uniref:uncharacterized protein LOC141651228 n=1 Tax=Silene latifolia TaxID=37657 RepID=UPI003D771498
MEVLSRGDLPSVKHATDTLHIFSTCSVLKVNIDKTDAYFGGVSAALKQQILCETGLSEGSFPFRYLGLPIYPSRLSISMYEGLTVKLSSLLQRCQSEYLSYGGKIQVIQSIVFGLGNFWGSSILLSKNISKYINRACRQLFWGSPDHGTGSVWCTWIRHYFLKECSIWDLQIKEFYPECLRGVLIARDRTANQLGGMQHVKELL